MGASDRGEAEVRKLEKRHAARWHMRPAAPLRPNVAALIREICARLGVVRVATLAEIRESEKSPIRLLMGLLMKGEADSRFEEVARVIAAEVAAAAPGQPTIESVALGPEQGLATAAPYRVYP